MRTKIVTNEIKNQIIKIQHEVARIADNGNDYVTIRQLQAIMNELIKVREQAEKF